MKQTSKRRGRVSVAGAPRSEMMEAGVVAEMQAALERERDDLRVVNLSLRAQVAGLRSRLDALTTEAVKDAVVRALGRKQYALISVTDAATDIAPEVLKLVAAP